MTRSTMVDRLVQEMVTAMEGVEGSNADEVMSAILTLALRTIKASLSLGADRERLRHAIEILLLECADSAHAN